jgi:carboxyl-terminal processing protease
MKVAERGIIMLKYKRITLILAAIALMGFVKGDQDLYFQIGKSIDIFGQIYKEVNLNYVDRLDPEEFMLAGIKGMLSSLDPYTVYIDETLKNDIDVITKGKYGGIGATVGLRNGQITIVDLIEGYSAQRQGIRIGDIIKIIDGTEITKENYDELSAFLKGEPGTVVSVIIERDGVDENIVFNLLREEVEIKNLTYYGFEPANSNNIYLKLSGFTRTAGEEIKKAIVELQKKKEIKSIILDLRGNPGGLLDVAIDICEKFLKKDQLIVSVANRDSTSIKKYRSKEEPLIGDKKLVVLVDDGSASASEIVAGAIQDHDRGIILGNTSFGKGLVQTLIPLPFNASLKITTARYFTPSGRSIQKIDYSKRNKVFETPNIIDNSLYKTDNERTVRGAGGIVPDTIVYNDADCHQIGNMVARGVFFKFATNYFNTRDNVNLNSILDDDLFENFKKYLNDEKFEYKSKSEKLLEELKKLSEKNKYDKSFISDVDQLIVDAEKMEAREIEVNKKFILTEIKKELSARINGRLGRITEFLKTDKQFETAYNLLQNDEVYNNLLSVNN